VDEKTKTDCHVTTFRRGTALTQWNRHVLKAIAHALGDLPRKTLAWQTPAETFNQQPLCYSSGLVLQRPFEFTAHVSVRLAKDLFLNGIVESTVRPTKLGALMRVIHFILARSQVLLPNMPPSTGLTGRTNAPFIQYLSAARRQNSNSTTTLHAWHLDLRRHTHEDGTNLLNSGHSRRATPTEPKNGWQVWGAASAYVVTVRARML